jgi:CheY-like chemotaxis protein
MDKVLIADSDRSHVGIIRKGFKELHHFELLTALNGKTAIEKLQQQKVSVFVTDCFLPDMQGVDLLAYMTHNHPFTPCIVMLEPGKPKPWFSNHAGHEDMLYYLERPFEFGTLASMIFVGLNLKDEGLTRKGMTLRHLLPLIEISSKTCRMEISSGNEKKGFFYFHNGILLDAIYNNLSGEEAAKEMIEWDGITISFSELPEKRKVINVNAKLMDIADAKWKKTTQSEPETPPTPAQLVPPEPSSKIEGALKRYAGMLKTIKGYMGLAILNPDGTVIASDSAAEHIDFKLFSSDFNSMLFNCNKILHLKGFDQCTGFTVHTKKGIIVMMSSDVYKHGNFRFIGLMAPEGNGYFLQVQLEKVIPQILAAA